MKIKTLVITVILLISVFLSTFNILKNPPGIETDEGVIGHNAALIAKTGRDQNHRFMPFFILSGDKMDWKQPVIVYATVIFFKLFGQSLLVFKLVNVTISLITMVLLLILLKLLFKDHSWIGLIIYTTTPMVIISSRIGTEALSPVLFSTMWLLSLMLFKKSRNSLYLILSALALGIGFYSYKGMRLILPPWTILTVLYICWANLQTTKFDGIFTSVYKLLKNRKFLINIFVFGLTLAPFIGITPWLEQKYPGSVFERTGINFESYRHTAYYWFSNLSPAFLFVEGDIGRIFSVEQFGAFLLATFPWFIVGILKALQEKSFITFVLITYLFTPILFGLAGSLGYGHRLLAIVPTYVILTTVGFLSIWDWLKKSAGLYKTIALSITLVMGGFYLLNLYDFFTYYYFKYPNLNDTQQSFLNNYDTAFHQLAIQAEKYNLQPYIQKELVLAYGEGTQFFQEMYFKIPPQTWTPGEVLPTKSVLLTRDKKIQGLEALPVESYPLYLLKSRE